MNAPRPLDRPPEHRSGASSARLFPFAQNLPDRRGEALQIFTTIFLRPALELRSPIRRIAGAVAGAGTGLRTRGRVKAGGTGATYR
jgi:hypothetical protein